MKRLLIISIVTIIVLSVAFSYWSVDYRRARVEECVQQGIDRVQCEGIINR